MSKMRLTRCTMSSSVVAACAAFVAIAAALGAVPASVGVGLALLACQGGMLHRSTTVDYVFHKSVQEPVLQCIRTPPHARPTIQPRTT